MPASAQSTSPAAPCFPRWSSPPSTSPIPIPVLAGSNLAAQVADRAAEKPGAQVEADHERGVGHRLEEDGAVARTVRTPGRLANQTSVQQGLERKRDGRLGDARTA